MPSRTVAVVPFRSPGTGKTRLATAIDRTDRAALARAMFVDVVTALIEAELEVVVAAAGPAAVEAARARRVAVVTDPPGTVTLDDAVGAAAARLRRADALLVVAADLPLLTADDVHRVVDQPAAVVVAATHDGGTGALLRRPTDVIPTAYGPGSAGGHRALATAAGVEVTCLDLPGFRHDLDTPDDLVALSATGSGRVGAATARLLPGLLERHTAILRGRAPVLEELVMPQGTVKSYDPATSTGTVVDDTLRERRFDRDAFTASGLQELRIGQRVRYQLEGDADDARVTHLNIVSL